MAWSSRVVDKHWKRKRPPLLPGEPNRDEYVYLVRVVDKEGGPPHWQVRESCVAYNQSYSWCGPFKTLARGREVFEHWKTLGLPPKEVSPSS